MNITELKRLAEAATPGEWYIKDPKAVRIVICASEITSIQRTESFTRTAIAHHYVMRPGSDRQMADAKYIAAANPAAVLELIERLEAAERDAARYRWLRSHEHFRIAVGDGAEAVFTSTGDDPEELDAAIDAQRGKQ